MLEMVDLPIVLILIAVDTCVLALGIALFQEGQQTVFRRYGTLPGWGLCALAVTITVVLSLLPFWALLPIVSWWVMALTVFNLTVRQALQLNVLTFLFHLLLLLGMVSAFA